MGMAKAGHSFRQILSFYYRHTKLTTLYGGRRGGR
jgi:peptidoglycan hydrolase-like amidase